MFRRAGDEVALDEEEVMAVTVVGEAVDCWIDRSAGSSVVYDDAELRLMMTDARMPSPSCLLGVCIVFHILQATT